MPAYTQYFNITPGASSSAVCLLGTCEYYPATLPLGLYFLRYGHHVTLTFLASDVLPSRVGVYSDTSSEFAIDVISPTVGGTISHNFPLGDTYIEFEFQAPSGFDFNVRIDYDQAPGETAANGFCAYGYEPNPGAAIVTTITGALVDAAIAILGGGPLVFLAFDTLIGAPILLGDLCSSPPPSIPEFDSSDFIPGTSIWSPGSYSKRLQAFKGAVWGFYCQCTPAPGGSPAPVAPPPPVPFSQPLPTGGTQPTIVCDNEDLCTTLNGIMRQLAAMNQQILYARSDIQLIQRQKVPFAYVPGPVHAGLTGNGQFAVSAILGLSVTLTTPPYAQGEEAGDPVAIFGSGWVTSGTPDAWRSSRRIVHNPFWLDVEPDDTLVGYSLPPGSVATIAEFVREP